MPYKEGQRAFLSGKLPKDNPHGEEYSRLEWKKGYDVTLEQSRRNPDVDNEILEEENV